MSFLDIRNFCLAKNSINLNLKLIDGVLLSEINSYSSEESVFCNSAFDSSGTIPDVTSTKQSEGYNTHHQF